MPLESVWEPSWDAKTSQLSWLPSPKKSECGLGRSKSVCVFDFLTHDPKTWSTPYNHHDTITRSPVHDGF
ncbi:hypothetical protein AAMO2058_001271900 [Amorphochlora amoebiformis]